MLGVLFLFNQFSPIEMIVLNNIFYNSLKISTSSDYFL